MKVLGNSNRRYLTSAERQAAQKEAEKFASLFVGNAEKRVQLMDTIGVMTDNSLSWSSGNTEYYLVSDVMSQNELIEVAQSIVGITSLK